MKRLAVFLLVLSLLTCTISCGGSARAGKSLNGKALDFEARDINGNMVKLSKYSGKIIMLNFFATWCPPCRKEMPDFNDIAKERKRDVKIIGVNVGRENLSKVRNFVNSGNLEFDIVIDDGSISNLYGPITAIPVTVIIDRDFNIVKRHIGLMTKETLIEELKDLL